MTKPIRDTLDALSWRVLPHAAYSPDLAPSDYHFFASMTHALAEQRFGSYEDVWTNTVGRKTLLTYLPRSVTRQINFE